MTSPKMESNFNKLPQQLHMPKGGRGPSSTFQLGLFLFFFLGNYPSSDTNMKALEMQYKKLQRQGLFQELLEREIDLRIVLHDSPYTISQTQGHRFRALKIGCRAIVVFHMLWKMP
jgi:hypothetical protein